MKKFLLLCLLALLPLSAALAEYDGWLLTAPDTGKSFAWKVNPLDARNAVVFANPLDLDQTAAHWTGATWPIWAARSSPSGRTAESPWW